MRARLFGALLAAAAAQGSTVAVAEQRFERTLACAAPTLLQCALIVPGFDRWFIAPLGIAPSDGEMAARICGPKRLPVASATRKPTGSGPLNQTTALEVVCGEPRPAPKASTAARAAPAPRPARDFEGERFDPTRRREVDAAPRPPAKRRANEAREAERRDPPPRVQPRPAPAPRAADAVAVRPAPPPPPPPTAAARAPETPPAPEGPRPQTTPPAPRPATTPALPAPKPEAPKPKPDPSIMYDHL